MGKIEGNEVFGKSLIEAPLQFAKNVDVAVESLKPLIEGLKKAESTMAKSEGSKNVEEANQKRKKTLTELQKVEVQIQKAQEKSTSGFVHQKAALDKLNQETREAVKEARGLVGEYDKLNKERTKSAKILKNLIASEKASNEEIEKAQKAFDSLDESVRKADKAVKDNSKDVGGYEDAINSATEGNEAFSGSATNILQNFISISQQSGGVKGFFQSFVGGINQAIKAGIKFILTPIGATIALVVAGIAALTAIIQRNEAASDKFNEVWAAGTAILDVIIDRVLKLYQAYLTLFTGDFKRSAELLSEAFTGLGDAVEDAAKRGVRIAKLTAEVERLNTSLKLTDATLEGQIRKFEILADDATRSFKQREQASEEARKLNILLARERENVARKELELTNEQIKQALLAGKINRSLRDQQAEAIAKLVTAESEALAIELENEKTRRELKQDRLEKDLDILIDGFDNIKTINDRIIEDDERVLNERIDTFNKLTQLSDNSFNKQIETIKKFTKIAFDENELLAEQDAVILNEKIRRLGLSEIIEGRLLEIVRERRIVLAEAGDLEKALTQAIVDQNSIRELDSILTESTITDNYLKELDKRVKNHKAASDKISEEEAEATELRSEIIAAAIDTSAQLLSDFTSLRIQQIGQELQAVEFARNQELEKVKGNKRAEEAVNIEFNNKKRELERRQLNAQKADSLFQIAIATAVNIAKAFPNPALIAFAAAIGASQAAVVLAQQVPQFDEGVKSSPSDYIAGEKRPEFRKSGGKWSLVDRPTLFGNSPGDTIIGGSETDNILGNMSDLSGPNLLSNTNFIGGLETRKERNRAAMVDEIKRSNKELVRTIKNKTAAHISVSNKRTEVKEKHGNNWVNRLDARYKGKV